MEVIVAVTGSSGNMGREALKELMSLKDVQKVKALLFTGKRDIKFGNYVQRIYKDRLEIIYGDIADYAVCEQLIKDADYVLNMAAVIPPLSDNLPKLAERCNYTGAKNIVDIISKSEKQAKLVHISTVGVYGHRNHLHPWGRVGDPLLPSAFDYYAGTKVRAERYVLDSGIRSWCILRQTAMLHDNIMTDNLKDGLMFHTALNVPLEWVTARDSGLLMKRIIEYDLRGKTDGFWNRCYNIGSLKENRLTGFEIFEGGFKLIGADAGNFFKPSWYSIRNFHGLWFADGGVLNEYFKYQSESVDDFWKQVLKKHKYYNLGKMVPGKLISLFVLNSVLKDKNSPQSWLKAGDKARIKAFFGSDENIDCFTESFNHFPLLKNGKIPDGFIDYEELRNIKNARLLSHGYDESKNDSELDIEDMRGAAKFRGGRCISETMQKGDMYIKLEWECHDGHRFYASPYTVLKAGHWCAECTYPGSWDFDRLAKFMPFYAQVWYDTHAKEENCKYFFDQNFNARYIRY